MIYYAKKSSIVQVGDVSIEGCEAIVSYISEAKCLFLTQPCFDSIYRFFIAPQPSLNSVAKENEEYDCGRVHFHQPLCTQNRHET